MLAPRTRRVQPRHELKYPISPIEADLLARRLGMLLPRDRHAGASGRYTVRSLYFDTLYDDALRQKLEGFSRRAKWRLRTYEPWGVDATAGIPDSPVLLEKKFKLNGLGTKSKTTVPREVARALIAGESTPGLLALAEHDEVLAEFVASARAQALKPATIVAYEREAFCYRPGNVRITIDRDVRSSPSAESFLDASRLLAPVNPGSVVLEVKYDAYLPDIVRDAVNLSGCSRTAYSKYALARRYE